MAAPSHHSCFESRPGPVEYAGARINSAEAFQLYLSGPVQSRLKDAGQAQVFESDLRALATTQMASATLSRLLAASNEPSPWEVGEALAECLLTDIWGALWPWNAERDKRTPRASLPGADLVGLVKLDGTVYLLLGEVKSSSDVHAPPQVMMGNSGMIHQVDRLASSLSIQQSLLKWLHVRCKDTELWPLYQEAMAYYLKTGGRQLMLCGMLMRDTEPTDRDLAGRAEVLVKTVSDPTRVRLQAWYCPAPIPTWPALMVGASP